MAKVELDSPADFAQYVGGELGVSDWVEVTQEMINMFADATGDHQWIHVDVERAIAESPFGGPIAHGYLTISMIGGMMFDILAVSGCKLVVNYGLNKVRMPAPVPVNSRVRAKARVTEIKDLGEGNIEVEFNVTV